MGLPEILISFQNKSLNAISRSGRGVVALVLKDDAKAAGETIYTRADQVLEADWTATNYDYIQKAFLGNPSKIIVERIAVASANYTAVLAVLKNKKFNYLAIPGIATGDVSTIATWIKTARDADKKTFKAVLPGSASDHEGIINFTTDGIKVGATTYTTAQYTARIAGVLAGLSLDRSATYFVLDEVDSITESADPNADINAGKLILVNDGTNIKIGRAVNSFVTTTATKGDDFKKIKIIEGMDLVRDDIREEFESDYIGDVINTYDNKMLFLAAVNSYFKTLERDYVLDGNAENKAEIDFSAQYDYLVSEGVDVDVLNEQQIKEYNTGSKVFVLAKAKFVDAMEDLTFSIYI